MKATDLMIGDWVEVTQGESIFAKVQMIDGYGDNATADECVCDAIYYAIDELKPIPLTPEILEKNGFVKVEDDEIWYKMPLEGHDVVGVSPFEDVCWIFGAAIFPDLIEHLRINYVHELQHVMRLCGIEKEIIL